MGDPRSRNGSQPDPFRLFAAAVAAAAMALAHPAGAQSRSPRSDTAPPGVTGSIVGYQESPGSAILYHEEKGGMVTQVPPPVPKASGKTQPANAPATKAAANGGSKAPAKGGTKAPAPVASKLAQQ
jgi:hypothetical protein